MFSGIIEYLGTVSELGKLGGGRSIAIEAGPLADGMKPGDSLAVNGVCLTATSVERELVRLEAVSETLDKTTLGGLKAGARVNLERALAAGGRLDGHIVQGHVDTTTIVMGVQRLSESVLMEFALNEQIAPFVVGRGSVAVDGVSLTVARLKERSFIVSLVGFTWSHTTLGMHSSGDMVNVETDIIGKYVVASLERTRSAGQTLTEDKLRGWGY
jgi:riboflavin synthase